MNKEEKDPKEDLITRLEGALGYEIELYPDKYDVKLQLSTENNFAAMVCTRDQLTAVINQNNIPTLKKSEKLTPKELQDHLTARNLLDSLCTGIGSHLLDKAKNQKISSKIIEMPQKKLILPKHLE